MKSFLLVLCAFLIVAFTSCSKPLASARVMKHVEYTSRGYAAAANDIYYALRWSLQNLGYSVANENLQDGIIVTTWLPVKSSSHYVEMFGRPDYGVTNSYYQLEIQIVPDDGRTQVKVGSRMKTLVARLKSSGVEERRVLDSIGGFLRKSEPDLTNLGVNE